MRGKCCLFSVIFNYHYNMLQGLEIFNPCNNGMIRYHVLRLKIFNPNEMNFKK
jgi:hypothetical protein